MKRIIIILFLLSIIQQGFTQSLALAKADKLFNLFAYSEAVEIYEKHLQRDAENEYLIQQTAYCYDKMKYYKKALHYYDLHVKGSLTSYEDFFQYGQLLLIDEQFEKATEVFNQCRKKDPNDLRPIEQIKRIKSFDEINRLQFAESVKNISFNTRFSEMCPAFFKDSIAFVSSRDSSSNNLYSWDSQPFLDIYEFVKDKKGNYQAEKIPGINSKYHEGSLIFTNNDEKVWFTRNNQKSALMSGEETNNIRIYFADFDGKKWKNIEEFQYNSDEYSVGHPAFSPSGDTMYFASSMPGSLGQTDLFMVKRLTESDKNGKEILSWSEPENLGEQFNTEGTEMFPFVDAHGVIYFASDGRNGFGGFDNYAAFPENNSYNIINLGQPINSTYDDFGFIMSNDFKDGYFTSNRPGGAGNDDIYYFKTKQKKLDIIVKSLIDKKIVPDAMVIYKLDGKEILLGETDLNGLISMNFAPEKNYYLNIMHPDFSSKVDSIKAYEYIKNPFQEKIIYLDRLSQLRIIVSNEETKQVLQGVKVNIGHGSINYDSLVSNNQGIAKSYLSLKGNYSITLNKDGYISQDKSIGVATVGKKDYDLKVIMTPIYQGKTFQLENLYYDLDSAVIRTDAALVLDELYKTLIEYPEMEIELSSHTDCRESDVYNMDLSQRRAQSAVNYLVKKGIDRNRMVAKGYGESKPIINCPICDECSEEQHQLNRRTEIKILKY